MNLKRKLWWAQHKNDVFKYGTILSLILIVTISVIYFTYSKFSSSNESTMYETTVEPFIKNDYFIASYIDGEWSNEIPGKNDGYIVDKIVCDNGAIGTWDYNDWRIYIDNATKKIKCGVYFVKGIITNFDYFANSHIFIAPNAGTYKLEVWGAQGGSGIYRALKTIGGYGGYSTGIVKLNKDDQLYIYIGGTTTDYLGGFNGGGDGNCDESNVVSRIAGGGGGYYGGSAGDWSLTESLAGSGGGGSGYIGNSLLTNKAMYCYNCKESSEESTKTISTTCAEETPTANCAKKGNGYARITYIG